MISKNKRKSFFIL